MRMSVFKKVVLKSRVGINLGLVEKTQPEKTHPKNLKNFSYKNLLNLQPFVIFTFLLNL